jgi:hypothetical protein
LGAGRINARERNHNVTERKEQASGFEGYFWNDKVTENGQAIETWTVRSRRRNRVALVGLQ